MQILLKHTVNQHITKEWKLLSCMAAFENLCNVVSNLVNPYS